MRTSQQLVELLTRHGVELAGGTPEAKASRWLRDSAPGRSVVDSQAEGFHIFTRARGTLGIQVSARYDWDRGAFVVRDWWTFNA